LFENKYSCSSHIVVYGTAKKNDRAKMTDQRGEGVLIVISGRALCQAVARV